MDEMFETCRNHARCIAESTIVDDRLNSLVLRSRENGGCPSHRYAEYADALRIDLGPSGCVIQNRNQIALFQYPERNVLATAASTAPCVERKNVKTGVMQKTSER